MTTTNTVGAHRIEIARRIALATGGALPGESALDAAESARGCRRPVLYFGYDLR